MDSCLQFKCCVMEKYKEKTTHLQTLYLIYNEALKLYMYAYISTYKYFRLLRGILLLNFKICWKHCRYLKCRIKMAQFNTKQNKKQTWTDNNRTNYILGILNGFLISTHLIKWYFKNSNEIIKCNQSLLKYVLNEFIKCYTAYQQHTSFPTLASL